MKREVHYCDACGTEMTWIDADDNSNVQGIVVPEFMADVTIRKDCGSSGRTVWLRGQEFCSWECFHLSLIAFSKELEVRTKDMERF